MVVDRKLLAVMQSEYEARFPIDLKSRREANERSENIVANASSWLEVVERGA